jgi:predicted amidohydrolase
MRVALGQINTTVGDFEGNCAKMADFSRRAAERGASIVAFPELSLTGYPPRDLVEKPSFLDAAGRALERLADATAQLPLAIVAGTITAAATKEGKSLYNSAAVIRHGRVEFRQDKMLLPTYDVFDEGRYFVPAERQQILVVDGNPVALTICEDAWNDKQFWERRLYRRDPVEELAASGARALISINASPYHMGKRGLRSEIFRSTALRYKLPVVYVNQVGGNDQLVFDGSSFALDAEGNPIASAASFAEDLVLADLDARSGDLRGARYPRLHPEMRVPPGVDRTLGRHRFLSCRRNRRRRRRPRQRDRSRHARAPLERTLADRCPRTRRKPRNSVRSDPDSGGLCDFHRATRAALCGLESRRDGGESPVAPARRDADGPFEQVWRHRAHHRQQE